MRTLKSISSPASLAGTLKEPGEKYSAYSLESEDIETILAPLSISMMISESYGSASHLISA